jgi:hypothetical protein
MSPQNSNPGDFAAASHPFQRHSGDIDFMTFQRSSAFILTLPANLFMLTRRL